MIKKYIAGLVKSIFLGPLVLLYMFYGFFIYILIMSSASSASELPSNILTNQIIWLANNPSSNILGTTFKSILIISFAISIFFQIYRGISNKTINRKKTLIVSNVVIISLWTLGLILFAFVAEDKSSVGSFTIFLCLPHIYYNNLYFGIELLIDKLFIYTPPVTTSANVQ